MDPGPRHAVMLSCCHEPRRLAVEGAFLLETPEDREVLRRYSGGTQEVLRRYSGGTQEVLTRPLERLLKLALPGQLALRWV